jgi:hypothetical protein
MDVGALCGTYEMIPVETMRIKIVGCLGPIAMRLGDVETNKVGYTQKLYNYICIVITNLTIIMKN